MPYITGEDREIVTSTRVITEMRILGYVYFCPNCQDYHINLHYSLADVENLAFGLEEEFEEEERESDDNS